MFMAEALGQEWELREFRLSRTCTGSACTLTAHNTPVQNNPFGPLFHDNDSPSLAFQKEFVGQVPSLAAKTLSAITMTTPIADDGPQSDEGFPTNNNYADGKLSTTFSTSIASALSSIGRSDLTPTDVLNRATTQSCAGCHQISGNQGLGASLVWPASLGFTHVDEFSHLSTALTGVFLPYRARVLQNFIQAHCGGGADAAAATTDVGLTVGGSAVGAAN
jgi:hypothetical protein